MTEIAIGTGAAARADARRIMRLWEREAQGEEAGELLAERIMRRTMTTSAKHRPPLLDPLKLAAIGIKPQWPKKH